MLCCVLLCCVVLCCVVFHLGPASLHGNCSVNSEIKTRKNIIKIYRRNRTTLL